MYILVHTHTTASVVGDQLLNILYICIYICTYTKSGTNIGDVKLYIPVGNFLHYPSSKLRLLPIDFFKVSFSFNLTIINKIIGINSIKHCIQHFSRLFKFFYSFEMQISTFALDIFEIVMKIRSLSCKHVSFEFF